MLSVIENASLCAGDKWHGLLVLHNHFSIFENLPLAIAWFACVVTIVYIICLSILSCWTCSIHVNLIDFIIVIVDVNVGKISLDTIVPLKLVVIAICHEFYYINYCIQKDLKYIKNLWFFHYNLKVKSTKTILWL